MHDNSRVGIGALGSIVVSTTLLSDNDCRQLIANKW